MSKKFSSRVAQSSDYDAVLDFLQFYYYKEEPITVFHPQPGHTKDDEEFTMAGIPNETVLMAIDDESGKLVGALAAGPIEPGDADKMIEDAKTAETEKWRDIMLFLAYIEKKADVLNRFKIPNALHVHALGVHQDFRGNKLGEKLFTACFENAKRLNYPMVTTDFTSNFSIKIGEQLGMENVSRVTYDEYNKFIGRKLFLPKEPNYEVLTYIKKIE